jgi:hypothetical protein
MVQPLKKLKPRARALGAMNSSEMVYPTKKEIRG